MNIFAGYRELINVQVSVPKHSVNIPERKSIPILMPDRINIGGVENIYTERGIMKAHRAEDYRRHKFTLHLLPDIHLPLDDILGKED